MEGHVGEDDQVLAEGEEGVDSCLTVLVVPSEEVRSNRTAADVEKEEAQLPAVWCHFLRVDVVSPDHVPQSAGHEHVQQWAGDEHDEGIFMNTVSLCGRHVCEQQQACVFSQAKDERQPAQHKLRQLLEAAAVKAEVGEGHQVARRRVQAYAAAPDITLWHLADGGAYGWEVVWYSTVRESGLLKVVHQRDEEAGDEADQRKQDRPHGKTLKREPDEGPVQAAVGPLKHPFTALPAEWTSYSASLPFNNLKSV